MIPSVVALASHLSGATADGREAERERTDVLLRAFLEQLDLREMENTIRHFIERIRIGSVQVNATRQGDELHIGVQVVLPFRTAP